MDISSENYLCDICVMVCILIQNVQLLGRSILFQQFACDFSLRGQYDAILCQYSQSCAGVRDGFESVFHLV